MDLDYNVFLWLYNVGRSLPLGLLRFCAENLIYIVLIPFLIWAIARRQRVLVLTAIVSGAVGYTLATLLKIYIKIPRPFIERSLTPFISESGNSFPSRHELTLAAIAFAVLPENKRWGIGLIVTAVIVGIARIMAGVHYPSDILGGFVLGGIIGFLASKFFHGKIVP